MDPILLSLGLGFLGSTFFGLNAESEKEYAIDLQQKQTQLQYQQKLTQLNYTILDTLDHQQVVAAGKGISMGNPTIQAFGLDTLNKRAKIASNLKLENEIANLNYDISRSNVENSLFANLFGNAVSIFGKVGSIYG